MNTVSVIVPFYKGLPYLQDCLDSLLAQTHSNMEVLVIRQIDDAPAGRLLDEYQVKGLSLLDVTAFDTQGVAAARGRGLERATGEYVYFLDSDDYLSPDAIGRLVGHAEEHSCDAVFGNRQWTWFKRENVLGKHASEGGGQNPAPEAAAPESLPSLLYSEMSVLNVLIRKSFLEAHSLSMDGRFTYYSDEVFLTALLSATPKTYFEPLPLYYQRRHNDPVNLPSLSQTRDEGKAEEYGDAYAANRERSQNVPWLADALDYRMCRYALGLYIFHDPLPFLQLGAMTKGKFEAIFRDLDFGRFAELTKSEKGVLKRIRKGRLGAAHRLSRLILFRQKKKGVLGSRIQWYRAIDRLFFRRLPIREDWIMFECFYGKHYADSCKYIYEYLLEQETRRRFRFVWALDDKKRMGKGRPTIVKPNGLRYFYYTSRCKYWVNNVRQPAWWEKRPGMVFLQTWHGTPLKRLVFDMDDVHVASPLHKQDFYRQSRSWDYLLSDNHFSTEVFERAFQFDRSKILECGYPRNDVLYRQGSDELAKSVRRRLDVPEDVTTILYAPTWRDDDYYGPGQYKFSLSLNLDALHQELGDGYMVLLRTHHYIADSLNLAGKESFVRNVSDYDDVGELYLISDMCVTDYSSVFFDYANLRRPLLFYVYDFERYNDVLRGFYIDMEAELPGPLLYTNEEVVEAIQNIDWLFKDYQTRYDAFVQKYCHLDDGFASKRVCQKVFTR